jgi:hypothetical protein
MLEGLHALDGVVADRDHFPLGFIQRMAARISRIFRNGDPKN